MTTLAAVQPTPLRPVPWRALGWVMWRRYRSALAATAAVLVVIGGYLVVDGARMRSAYASYLACSPNHSAKCQFTWQTFHERYGAPGLLGVILLFLPGIIGAFAGAPVLAREFETGTFRFTWTQGVGRMRWALAAIVPGAVGVAVIMAAFGALVSWHNQPLLDSGITPRLHATVFPVTGVAGAGWALAGFALGVLAGQLWRRVLAGLATAFATWFALAFLAAQIRMYYLTPLTTTSLEQSGRDFEIGQWWTRGGVRVDDTQINSVLQAIGFQQSGGDGKVAVAQPGTGGSIDPVQYLLQHGYTQITNYQPDSRYWTFQWIEFGALTAFSLLLLGAAFWLVRRRST